MARSTNFLKWFVPGFLAVVLLASCGGGGGGTTTGSGVTIVGQVAGSTFVAVDDGTNAEVRRAVAGGTPKGFVMTVPAGASYRFYLLENESAGSGARVYPYYSGGMNVFRMADNAAGTTIALGSVAPDFATGHAASVNAMAGFAGVTPMGIGLGMPTTLAGAAFSPGDMAGSWRFGTLAVSGTMAWTRGTLAVDNSGIGTMTGVVRNGAAVPNVGGIPYAMSPSGMFHVTGDASFEGVMSRDKGMMAANFTDNTGGSAMMFARRNGTTYSLSDIDGAWTFHRMNAGVDNAAAGWAWGTMSVTGGVGTVTAIATSSGSTAELGRTFPFAMTLGGVLTESTNAAFEGAMSPDKGMVAATDNVSGHPAMWILVRAGSAFGMADLSGDWLMNGLVAGNAGSRAWMTGQDVIDLSGVMNVPQMTGPSGAMSMAQSTLSMNAGGGVTMSGMAGGGMMMGSTVVRTFHATMASSKGLMVSTYSDGTGGHRLALQMK